MFESRTILDMWSEEEWKQFVQNCVNEIHVQVPSECWNHCPGQENPADIPSRGITTTVSSQQVMVQQSRVAQTQNDWCWLWSTRAGNAHHCYEWQPMFEKRVHQADVNLVTRGDSWSWMIVDFSHSRNWCRINNLMCESLASSLTRLEFGDMGRG